MSSTGRRILIGIGLLLSGQPLWAGMPSPELIITELGERRLEELSFFVVGFLVLTAVVRVLWNTLHKDIPALPQLTYGRTAILLVIWGLAMTVVLSLVSGARELMTPRAWEPDGITHRLSQPASVPLDVLARRVGRLESLRTTLLRFAATHQGAYPTGDEAREIPDDVWRVQPDLPMKFVYVEGLTAESTEAILVFEPEIYDDGQLVLMASGRIARLSGGLPAGDSSTLADGLVQP